MDPKDLNQAELTFAAFSAINLARAQRWHKTGGLTEWNIAEWTNAMCGEAGEAANAAKKLRRLECSMQQSNGDTVVPQTLEEARARVLKEVGDTVIYADLVCARLGGSLEQAVRTAFNTISVREGFPERV